MTDTQTVVAIHRDVSDRAPIFCAFAALGLNQNNIARISGVSAMEVSRWATGGHFPLARRLALLYVVTRLTGQVGAAHPPQSRYARRAAVARDAAIAWANLARAELDEDTRGTEDIERSVAMGERMLARLEAQ